MRLLIVTQAVDKNHPVLGFFHGWIIELAQGAEHVEVICLWEGEHALPENVRVHSLGKEHGTQSRAAYIYRFLSLVWSLRNEYDSAFVHMNQEYILIAGWLWKLLGKRISMWRNHWAGSLLTDIAAAFCTNVFCTSKHSYTVKYKKTMLMPVGVDTARFFPDKRVARVPRSILFLSRMAPSKRPDLLIEALGIMKGKDVAFTATFVGSPTPEDALFYEKLKLRAHMSGLDETVTFRSGVSNDLTPDIYRAHDVFVNTSKSGMFDKTLFEAAAAGCRVLASSEDWREMAGEESYFDTASALAERLMEPTAPDRGALSALVEKNSLTALGQALRSALSYDR